MQLCVITGCMVAAWPLHLIFYVLFLLGCTVFMHLCVSWQFYRYLANRCSISADKLYETSSRVLHNASAGCIVSYSDTSVRVLRFLINYEPCWKKRARDTHFSIQWVKTLIRLLSVLLSRQRLSPIRLPLHKLQRLNMVVVDVTESVPLKLAINWGRKTIMV